MKLADFLDRFRPIPPVTVVINIGKDMTEAELLSAFAVGPETPWFRAVIQQIEDVRVDALRAAASHGATNNPLAMAGAVGAYESLTNLLSNLNELREEAVGE